MGALDKTINTMAGLGSILEMLVGKKGGTESTTTSGGTETKQTMLDVNAMMKQLLEGAGTAGYGKAGLAANLTSGKRAGVYGGKSTELNLNDLLSRITTEASIAGAPTVVNKNPTTTTKKGVGSQSGMMSPEILGLGALALLAGSSAARKKIGVDGIWDEIFGGDKATGAAGGGNTFAELMGGSNNPAADAAFFKNFDTSGGGFQDVGFSAPVYDTAGIWSDIAPGAELTDGTFANFANFSDIGTDFFSGFADSGAAVGSDLAFNMGMEGIDAATGLADAAGGGIPYLGTALNVLEGDASGAILTGIGYAVGGPVGGAIGGIVDSVFGGGGDSLICTELHRQGILPDHIYRADSAFGATLPVETIRGYHLFARPYVRLMQKSRFATWAASQLALPWAQEMAFRMGAISKGNKFGSLLLTVGVPFFSMLDRIVNRNTKEYAHG